MGFYSLLLIFFCWCSDRVGRKLVILIGAFGFILLSYILFITLSRQTTLSLIAALFIFAILSSAIMVYPSLLVELFPVSIRYTGIAISYNLAFAFFGGLTPFIATYLIGVLNNNLAPSFYITLSAILCFIAVLTIKKLYVETEASL